MNAARKSEQNLTCPACGLTSTELRDTGRMGCARCYATFTAMVVRATAELHRSGPADPDASRPAPTHDRAALPWPTRRAEALRAAEAPSSPQRPKTTKTRR
jgi:protein arginine kinase activator